MDIIKYNLYTWRNPKETKYKYWYVMIKIENRGNGNKQMHE